MDSIMPDSKIVELFWQRREDAVAETQTKYGGMFYSISYGVLRCREDAEECVNDTYVKLWNSIPPDQPDDLGAFGCRIARNTALNRLKAASAEKRSHSEVIYDELSECIPSDDVDIADKLALSQAISRFLSSIPPRKRIMFVRRYFYMDTTRDIAKLLHVPDATVRMTLSRMRKNFRQFLEKEGFAE